MKKYPKRGSFQDVKLNAEAVGFQIKESYKGNKELKTQISNLEKALNIKKDTNGEIESITIDGGTF